MTYNMTAIATNSTNFIGFMTSINTELMGGWFGNILIVCLSAVILGSFLSVTNDSQKSFVGTAFITIIMALLLRAIDLIGNVSMFTTLSISGLIIAFSFRK